MAEIKEYEMKKTILSMAVMTALAGSLQAGGDVAPVAPAPADDSGFYLGMGLAAANVYGSDRDWFDGTPGQDISIALSLLAGYRINPYLAVEGRGTMDIWKADFTDYANFSLFVKPMYPATEEWTLYALLGYGWVNIDGDGGQADIINKGAFQWGLGTEYALVDNWSLFADYTWLLNDETADVLLPDGSPEVSHEMFTVGTMYKF